MFRRSRRSAHSEAKQLPGTVGLMHPRAEKTMTSMVAVAKTAGTAIAHRHVTFWISHAIGSTPVIGPR